MLAPLCCAIIRYIFAITRVYSNFFIAIDKVYFNFFIAID